MCAPVSRSLMERSHKWLHAIMRAMDASRPGKLPSRFRVAEWLVEREVGRIVRGSQKHHLRPMLMDLLAFLAERKGQVVTKEEILDGIWSSRFVSESALTRNVAELRRCLGDKAGRPRIIETIPKRGYRLIAEVESLPGTQPQSLPATKPMIAVLPFENLSGDPDQEYFSDGLTEEIITQLGSVEPDQLGVIARTSVMRYKRATKSLGEIAAELQVQYFLEGSVRREASRVRITAQLIQAADQTHLWTDSYDDDISQILTVQSKVAQDICEAIQIKISPPRLQLVRKRPVNPAAHEAYLKGLYYYNKFTPEAAQKAIQYFQQAVSVDPQHGLAHAALAQAFGMIGYWGFAPPAEVYPLSREEALKALQIDESLSVGHGALACVLCLVDWEYEAAEKELQRAVELNPSEATNHLWYSIYHALITEDADKAIAEVLTAARLDPWSPLTGLMASSVYLLLDDFEQALKQAREIVKMFPDSLHGYRVLGMAYLGEGLFEHAIAAFEKGVAVARESVSVAFLAQAYGLSGQPEKARSLIDELLNRCKQEYVPPTSMAWAYAGLGEMDRAFEWLETAFQQRCSMLLSLKAGPMFDPLQADPRFADLLRRLRLPG